MRLEAIAIMFLAMNVSLLSRRPPGIPDVILKSRWCGLRITPLGGQPDSPAQTDLRDPDEAATGIFSSVLAPSRTARSPVRSVLTPGFLV